MFHKFGMLLSIIMVCMPIGGLPESETLLRADPIATAAPVSHAWLVDPLPLVFLCLVLLAASKLARCTQRQSIEG
jgi:hypothetical protein